MVGDIIPDPSPLFCQLGLDSTHVESDRWLRLRLYRARYRLVHWLEKQPRSKVVVGLRMVVLFVTGRMACIVD